MSKEFMFAGGIAIAVFTVLALFLILSIILMREVPRQYVYTVKRNNKRHRILEAGTHWLLPFIESVEHKINLQVQQARFDSQNLITVDGQLIHFIPAIEYKIVEVNKYLEARLLPREIFSDVISQGAEKVIQKLTAKLVLSSKTAFNALLEEELNNDLKPYGVRIANIVLAGLELKKPISGISDASDFVLDENMDFGEAIADMDSSIKELDPETDWHSEAPPCFEVLIKQAVDANKENWQLIEDISQLEQELADYDLLADDMPEKEYPIIDQSGFTYSIIDSGVPVGRL